MSRDDYEDKEWLAASCAHDWWQEVLDRVRDDVNTCRMALDFPSVTRVNGQHPTIEGEAASFVISRVSRLLDHAEALIDDPTAYVDTEEWGEVLAPEVALEEARLMLTRAWRALLATARNTRNARALAQVLLALIRVVSLRRRLALRALRPAAARPERAHLERPAPLISLTQAAHGPPARGGLSMSPQLAGGGCL